MTHKDEYSTYRQWKSWDHRRASKPSDFSYFDGEMNRAGLGQARSILEIGFGTGVFLSWGRARGIPVVGVEIIPELVEQAVAAGHEAYRWNVIDPERDAASPVAGKRFDGVVAWDVIEHLTIDEAGEFLAQVATMLPRGGRLVARFPNGESPFSLAVQNGDCTHKMHVSRGKLEHLCIGSGFRLERYDNAFRVADRPSLAWAKYLIHCIRDAIEVSLGHLYYGKRRPLDPVATAVLIRE